MLGIADLAAMAFAAILFLLAVAASWLFSQVANHVPNPRIGFGPVSVHPFGWIRSGFSAMAGAFQDQAAIELHVVHALLHDTALVLESFATAVAGAVEHTWTWLEHAMNVTMVGQMAAAEAVAHGLFATAELNLRTAEHTINAGVQGARDRTTHLRHYVNDTVVPQLNSEIAIARHNAIIVAEDAATTALASQETALATRLGDMTAEIKSLSAEITSTVPAEIAAAEQAAKAAAATAIQRATSTLNQAIGAVQAAASADTATIKNLVRPQLAQLSGQLGDVAGALGIAGITGIDQVKQAIDGLIVGPIDQVRSKVDKVAGTIGTTLDQLGKQVAGISGETVTVAGVGTLSVVGAIAAIGTQVASLTRTMEDCAITSCPGPHTLESELKKLLPSLLMDAGVIAFMQQAITNPETVGKVIAGGADDIYSISTAPLDDLLGL